MANIKSQIKRVKTNEKRRQRNKSVRSAVRTAVRKFREAVEAGNTEEAAELQRAAVARPRQGGQQGRDPQEPGRQPQVGHGEAGQLRRLSVADATEPRIPRGVRGSAWRSLAAR